MLMASKCRQYSLSNLARISRPLSRSRSSLAAAPASTFNFKLPTPPPRFESKPPRNQASGSKTRAPKFASAEALRSSLHLRVYSWSRSPAVYRILADLGVPPKSLKRMLPEFVEVARAELNGPLSDCLSTWDIDHLQRVALTAGSFEVDKVIMARFLDWAAKEPINPAESSGNNIRSLSHLARLRQATDFRYPIEWFPKARSLHRKIILHVGPTNSGKTHNALTALAGAKTGVYAGPLRLLAHEVWERLNKGTIAPTRSESDTALDLIATSASREALDAADEVRDPKLKHRGRPCNLVTGEERRIVSFDAGLVSCTVEMLSLRSRYDVAVIDEIQMIGDSDRGGAWTAALLGLCADEIHLCGEDTVIDLVKSIVQQTGDELVINRYQRLTPLAVSKESLNKDLTKIRKGDCIVTFSRNHIFNLKRDIEAKTGLRCAVAYGRLPPEVRSEQAALFNDPNSGFDVMVASDAIGMGLNLKIKRVIFETLEKWNGESDVSLSLSQIKQIGGRAGRFGLHDGSAVGEVTTLSKSDLPTLAEAMNSPNTPIRKAVLSPPMSNLSDLHQSLPNGGYLSDVYAALGDLTRLHPSFRLPNHTKAANSYDSVDSLATGLNFEERCLLLSAPTPWREPASKEVMQEFTRMYVEEATVPLIPSLEATGAKESLEELGKFMAILEKGGDKAKAPDFEPTSQSLWLLEALHKIVTLYLWLSYRLPLAFHQQTEAFKLKADTESAIELCLQAMKREGKKAVKWSNAREAILKRKDGQEDGLKWTSHNTKRSRLQDLLTPDRKSAVPY